jgi:hypothetical protein
MEIRKFIGYVIIGMGMFLIFLPSITWFFNPTLTYMEIFLGIGWISFLCGMCVMWIGLLIKRWHI